MVFWARFRPIYRRGFNERSEARGFIGPVSRKVWVFFARRRRDRRARIPGCHLPWPVPREASNNLKFSLSTCKPAAVWMGPVRGMARIIQELEGSFRGATGTVIKVIWGRMWDPLVGPGSNDGCSQQRKWKTPIERAITENTKGQRRCLCTRALPFSAPVRQLRKWQGPLR